jgi:organic hydroperoxide reductase OsmC/OhrA
MSIQVKYHREGEVHLIETGNKAMSTIRINQTGLSPEERAGTAKQLLGASALFCYCAAIDGFLKTRAVDYSTIDAEATIETGTNAKRLGRITSISIKTIVKMDEDDAAVFDRCQKGMRQGCLVTTSLHDGIEVTYSLEAEFDDG